MESDRDRERQASLKRLAGLSPRSAPPESASTFLSADTEETLGSEAADTRQPLKRRNLRLPVSYWKRLEAIARQQDRSISEVVREAVRVYLSSR